MISIERLPAPFGCAAYGVDLTAGVDDDQFRTLSQALYQHRLLVLKDQTCDKDAFLRFGRQWGVPIQHVVDTARMPGYPDLLEVGNMARRKQDPLTRNQCRVLAYRPVL